MKKYIFWAAFLAFSFEMAGSEEATRSGKDNSLVSFYSSRHGNVELYVMNLDGSHLKRLTYHPAEDICPAWSPDGQKIAFVSDRDGNKEIYVMDADGGNVRRITFDPGDDLHQDWSPDSQKLAFVSARDGDKEIFVYNDLNGSLEQITHNSSNEMRPDWSADGKKILYNSDRDGHYEIYTMDANGDNEKRLVHTTQNKVFPRWNPDNSKIAYFAYPLGDIFTINSDGTGKNRLTFHPAVDEDPVWTPDGKKIVFQSTRNGNFEIYVMDADGKNQTRLTFHPTGDYWPDCSPYLNHFENNKAEMSAASGGVVQFQLRAGLDKGDGKYIVLGSLSGDSPGVPLPNGEILPINWDPFTELILGGMNTPVFTDFMGTLDTFGYGKAQVDSLGPLSPGFVGFKMHFAYGVNHLAPWDFVSEARCVEITP